MALHSRGLRAAFQLALAVAIAALAYVLYLSITEPYKVVERRKEVTQLTRARMDKVRTVLGVYQRAHGRFPHTLDSLVVYVRTDSFMVSHVDSLLGAGFVVDSLPYSPRTGRMFEYAVNDTSRVRIFLLKDPDSDDQIGSLEPDITLLNAANWQ